MKSYVTTGINKFLPPLPEEFFDDYKLGGYDDERLFDIMWKYLGRQKNCERAWARIFSHTPEVLSETGQLDILEFSTAHGAMLEILRELGHHVRGTDFNWAVNKGKGARYGVQKQWQQALLDQIKGEESPHKKNPQIVGWPYQPIIESLGIEVDIFDGGNYPYSYETDSFDYIYCYQAIEAYAPPEKWYEIIDEFCRISRKTVVVGFNPLPKWQSHDDEIQADLALAWADLVQSEFHGFRPTFYEFGETRRGIHPTAIKFQKFE